MKLFLKYAKNPIVVMRSIKVSLIIGSVLALINHYDAILNGNLNTKNIIQIILTYLIPYIVTTYGSAGQARHSELNNNSIKTKKKDTKN